MRRIEQAKPLISDGEYDLLVERLRLLIQSILFCTRWSLRRLMTGLRFDTLRRCFTQKAYSKKELEACDQNGESCLRTRIILRWSIALPPSLMAWQEETNKESSPQGAMGA